MILINPLIDIIIDWSFIIDLLTCWALSWKDDQHLVSHLLLYNTLFFCVSSFLAIRYLLSPSILLHWSYRQGCALAPHLSILTFDALGYFLDATLLQGKIQRMSIRDGYEMANNYIAHDFFFLFKWTKTWYLAVGVFCLFFALHLGLRLVIIRLIIGWLVLMGLLFGSILLGPLFIHV